MKNGEGELFGIRPKWSQLPEISTRHQIVGLGGPTIERLALIWQEDCVKHKLLTTLMSDYKWSLWVSPSPLHHSLRCADDIRFYGCLVCYLEKNGQREAGFYECEVKAFRHSYVYVTMHICNSSGFRVHYQEKFHFTSWRIMCRRDFDFYLKYEEEMRSRFAGNQRCITAFEKIKAKPTAVLDSGKKSSGKRPGWSYRLFHRK